MLLTSCFLPEVFQSRQVRSGRECEGSIPRNFGETPKLSPFQIFSEWCMTLCVQNQISEQAVQTTYKKAEAFPVNICVSHHLHEGTYRHSVLGVYGA